MSRPIVLGAIADDVTGATDLCNTLVREGMRTIQSIGPAPLAGIPETDAVVVALKSRTAPVQDAVSESLQALAWLRSLGAAQVFFKICSTFDSTPAGNIGPVADALLDALRSQICLVCPAFPTNGRTVYQGHLFVGDRLLSESSMAQHPLTPMTDSDLVRHLGRQTPRKVGLVPLEVVRRGPEAVGRRLEELRSQGVAHAVADAVADDDLRVLGAASAGLPLVTGGSGLALGLPDGFRRRGSIGPVSQQGAPVPSGPAAVLAGSCSAATQEQVRHMAAVLPSLRIDVTMAARDPAAAATNIGEAAAARLNEGPVLVYATASPDEVARVQAELGPERASRTVEVLLGEVARLLVERGVRRLVVAGGETSGAVVDALGVRGLEVGEEIAPGVPWMTSLGEPKFAFALKSGNFGAPDFFLEALQWRS